ncbi:AAA domain-containing protein [Butyrivibrio sp. FCS014]|uniref:AAA domain-containing protein n=1 Tax=Butyrivibrio sp. FCS014 TaxID=1408304 RepID=UPI001FA80E19|nr:AAA domain-containing protein [Butyrivibrio sp. FCS014]
MIDSTKYMIVAKGKIETSRIDTCVKNPATNKFDIRFTNGRTYSYMPGNVLVLSNPSVLNPENYVIRTAEGKKLYGAKCIYQFASGSELYWHIVFDGFTKDYKKSELRIVENCLVNKKSANLFDYLKDVSELSNLRNDKGELILSKRFEKVYFIGDTSALANFFEPSKRIERYNPRPLVFPFGCNQSQFQAVKNAMENQISIIQGPPGTGKTQTILNIIANLIIRNKSVLVVSNNNAATLNVMEKLSQAKYGMDFLVAPLGSFDNKELFVQEQTGRYPDLSDWIISEDDAVSINEINTLAERLQNVYKLQEAIAKLKEEQYTIEIEQKHFDEFVQETGADYKAVKIRRKLSSDKLMRLWQEVQNRADNDKKLTFWTKLKSVLVYGIADWDFYEQEYSKIITVLQGMYYERSLEESQTKLKESEDALVQECRDYDKQLQDKSLSFVKNIIARRYKWNGERVRFSGEDLYKNSAAVLKEYPIVLSTTFSARTSLNLADVEFDYVIMDEASQVDIATGALALSCAHNAVIVGDLKQLPNVVNSENMQRADLIRTNYNISEAYDFAHKSFLQSIVEAIPNVPSTLLKEHYRCHPRIISFCNQKFYDNELVVMTEDDNLGTALMAVKTVEGNHARGKYNQRQIDIIKQEILPKLEEPLENIGIIAPYNEQVNEIRRQIPGIDVATVHKYQGREKDVVILSTVDDQIKDFTDDPNLLNVAVSRAKKKLIVVVSGNEQEKSGNIVDLISYIQYNKMEVVDSKIYSVFDYLYGQYREKRWEYLRNHRRVSEYDSENLAYKMIQDILENYPDYALTCFEPLSMVVRDVSKLDAEEIRYAYNPGTHLDFLVYNRMSKQPVLAIEVDGFKYHKAGTAQHERDIKKNHILEKCGLKLVRLGTNESGEKEKIVDALNTL